MADSAEKRQERYGRAGALALYALEQRNGEGHNAREVARVLAVHTQTARNYLKYGTDLGYVCVYVREINEVMSSYVYYSCWSETWRVTPKSEDDRTNVFEFKLDVLNHG